MNIDLMFEIVKKIFYQIIFFLVIRLNSSLKFTHNFSFCLGCAGMEGCLIWNFSHENWACLKYSKGSHSSSCSYAYVSGIGTYFLLICNFFSITGTYLQLLMVGYYIFKLEINPVNCFDFKVIYKKFYYFNCDLLAVFDAVSTERSFCPLMKAKDPLNIFSKIFFSLLKLDFKYY